MEQKIIIDEVGNKYWCKDSKLHREDDPSLEYDNGDKS